MPSTVCKSSNLIFLKLRNFETTTFGNRLPVKYIHVQRARWYMVAFSWLPRRTFTLSPSIVSTPKWDSIRRDGLKSRQGLQNSATIIIRREISSFHGHCRKWGAVWERMKFRPWRERGESRRGQFLHKKSVQTVSDFYFPIRNDTNIISIKSVDITLLSNILTERR